jgi:hypothetical protein
VISATKHVLPHLDNQGSKKQNLVNTKTADLEFFNQPGRSGIAQPGGRQDSAAMIES